MRLKQIRLAGFKSFVEPTKIPFPTDMTAIVGPNGCGKSNVIDAVRWVLGESSARNLRGDAMTDVIFNGSTRRAPVSKASVELCFDNQNGRLVGEFGHYAEVAVRREVTRDGQNNYFLNGSKCRKRDITDLFLGTGLGPRSYAIIEQGMISRLIESKPKELRVFIDEAAGVSKYKERRRETETRINNTEENLLRLTDIESELTQQVDKLRVQAHAASRFRQLRDELRELRDLDRLSQVYRLDRELDALQQTSEQKEQQLALQQAQLAEQENHQVLLRQQEDEVQAQLEQATQSYFENASQLAKLEQQQQHTRQSQQEQTLRREALQERIRSTELELQTHQQTLAEQQVRHEQRALAGGVLDAQLENLQEQHERQRHLDAEHGQAFRQHQELLRQQQQSVHRTEQELRNLSQIHQRQENSLRQHREQLASLGNQDESELALLKAQIAEQELMMEEGAQQHVAAEQELQQRQQALAAAREQLSQQRQNQAATQARIESLQQVVEALSGDDPVQHPLSQALQVEPGWELAVEKVIGAWLHAELAEERDPMLPVALFNQVEGAHQCQESQQSLSAKVSGAPIGFLTDQVEVAESLEQAWQRLANLPQGHSVITQAGEWLGANWQHLKAPEQQQSLLLLEAQLNTQRSSMMNIESEVELAMQAVNREQAAQQQAAELLHQLKLQQDSASRQLHEQRSALALAAQQHQQWQQQRTQLLKQVEGAEQQLEADQHKLELLQAQLVELEEQADVQLEEHARYEEQSEQAKRQLEDLTAQLNSVRHQVHQCQLEEQQAESAVAQTRVQVNREQRQIDELQQALLLLPEMNDQQEQLLQLQDTIEELLTQQLVAEEKKAELEQQRHTLHQQQEALTERVKSLTASISEHQQKLQTQQLSNQELLTRRKLLIEQMSEDGESLKERVARLPEPDPEFDYAKAVRNQEGRIKRLGAVNLAAEAEYVEQSERLSHLSEQITDLQQALETLQTAIAKIDRETRSKFRETFDKVNTDLQQLFPQVFGGGTAWLELTEEDLLDTGVTIMARPPGKKNSTISLLSGGEKALTALALVFAIFRLNPAPFCMLDEVDAPLDEVNVGRFAELVERMSETVQFIFISHNKVTMEKASQLAGVTMHEPGVSRLVAVDIAQAVAMVE